MKVEPLERQSATRDEPVLTSKLSAAAGLVYVEYLIGLLNAEEGVNGNPSTREGIDREQRLRPARSGLLGERRQKGPSGVRGEVPPVRYVVLAGANQDIRPHAHASVHAKHVTKTKMHETLRCAVCQNDLSVRIDVVSTSIFNIQICLINIAIAFLTGACLVLPLTLIDEPRPLVATDHWHQLCHQWFRQYETVVDGMPPTPIFASMKSAGEVGPLSGACRPP